MKSFQQVFTLLLVTFGFFIAGFNGVTGQGLSGSYTVDTTGSGDFDSISAAATALNNKGVSGPVTINIKPGLYRERIQIDSVSGVSQQNTVTFQSSTKDTQDVKILQKGRRDTLICFQLKKSDHINFRYLTVEVSSRNGGSGQFRYPFHILKGGTHIAIKHCLIKNRYDIGNNIIVENTGFFNKNPIRQITIENNVIRDGQFTISTFLDARYIEHVTIKNNKIFSDDGISLTKGRNIHIKNNDIRGLNNSGTGIFLNSVIKPEIVKNKILRFGSGINIAPPTKKANALIANNFISASNVGLTGFGGESYHCEFYHNNVYLNKGTKIGSYVTRYWSQSVYKNNIFAAKKGAVINYNDTNSFVSDHNNFYTGSNFFAVIPKNLNPANNDTIKSFTKFKQKENTDANSLNVDPAFVSDTNLHVTNTSLKEKATPLSQVTTDIDGEQRDPNKPDIGADEIQAVADLVVNSASISPQSIESDQSFKVDWTVKNDGSIAVNSLWEDGVYLSRDKQLDKGKDFHLGNNRIQSDLQPGNTYKGQLGVKFPFIDSAGKFYVLINTNDSGTIENKSNNLYVISKPLNVTLSDRPELTITQVQVPSNINSGEQLKFSYTVKNTGNEQTQGLWYDKFYISSNKSALQNQLIPADSVTVLEEREQSSISLKPGQTYQASVKTTFPLRFSGQYYIKAYTDRYDDIPETNEGAFNTHISSAFNVNQTPLPDLQVAKINIDKKYFSGEYATFNYTIENTGSDKMNRQAWTDKVILTNEGTQEKLGTITHSDSLKPGEQLQVFDSFRMPRCETDTFRFQIITDIESDITELSELNNTFLSDTFELLIRPKPDLMVNNVSMLTNNPTTEQNGVEVELTVKNDGNTDYQHGVDGFLYNGVYLSKDKNLDVDKDRLLRLAALKSNIQAGNKKKHKVTFRMPADVPGDYYVFAYTDKPDKVCEVPFENNNKGRTGSKININLAPPKDLTPTSWNFNPKDRKTGEQINLTADIKNQKSGQIDYYNWKDGIFLIHDQSQDSIRLSAKKHRFTLQGNSSYQLKKTFNIPVDVAAGQYYLSLKADYEDDVYEHNAEGNNALNSNTFQIARDSNAVSDLMVQSISLKNSPKSGQKLKFNYTTKNDSKDPINLSGWKNLVLLKDNSGRIIKTNNTFHYGQLSGNQSNQNSASIQVPDGKEGQYQLVIRLDKKDKVFEYNEANNTAQKNIQIQLSPWADLDATITNFPSQVRSGQKLQVDYSIKNQGTGDLKKENWIDRLFLSRDQILDENDVKINSIRQQGETIKTSNSKNFTADTFIPLNLDGYYYLIIKADAEDQVYEHRNELNNVFVSSNQIQVKQTPPADLEVNNINITNRGDKSLTFQAEVINNGPNQVKGNWYYSTHISQDTVWDSGDPQKDGQLKSTRIQAGNTMTFQVDLDYPVVKPGYYRIFLKLDKLNQIPETDENNNTHLIADSFYINFVDTLEMDNKRQDRYVNIGNRSEPAYYRLDVGKDTGIYLQLEPDNKNLSTELYTRSEAIPDRLHYDHKHNNPYDAEQNIIIPSQDQARKDYILTRSNYIPHNNAYAPYSILAESKTFSIQRVHPGEGSNEGMIVMGIYGFDFEDKTNFVLINQNGTDTIEPIQQAVMNSTEGRAHFDLRGHSKGQYDVYAVKNNGDKTRLDQGFKVQDTGTRELTTSVSTPNIRLVGDYVYPRVFAGNKGKANAYDVSLNVVFFSKNLEEGDLSVSFNGSDAVYENFSTNPAGKGNIGDTLGIKYYSVYYPVVPSSSKTTFTFRMTSFENASVQVMAFWYDHPKTDWAFSGDVDDLGTSRFLHSMDSFIARELGKWKNTSGKLDNCSEDLKIDNMKKEVLDELKNQVICVHPFTPSAWAKRNLAEQASKGALKKLGVKRADDYAEFGKKVYEQKQNASTWWNRIPGVGSDPHYSDQVDFVFDCIKNDKDFRKKFRKERCIEEYEIPNPDYNPRDPTSPKMLERTRNRCKDDNNSGGGGDGPITNFVESIDPNEIIGPSGYTELKLIKPGKTMNYDILFENKPTATSPAQTVKITNPLPDNADIKSFQLGKFGFGDTTFDLPDRQRTTQRYTLGSGDDRVIVRIKAGIDPVNRKAFWTIRTIDPETGLPPKDPTRGFLPPNDSTGRGEGFVSYQINARENRNHGDSVTNQATIVFDDNAPIQTNTWVNLIATDPLKSKILQDYQKVDSTSVALEWKQVTQEPFSTEVSRYNLYVSKDDNNYERWLSGIPDKKARFTGEPGETYYFISQAIGVNGKTEPFKNNYEVKVTFDSASDTGSFKKDPVNMLRGDQRVKIYPNPSDEVTHVRFKLPSNQNVRFKLMNGQGKKMATLRNRHFMAGSHEFRFDPESLGLEGGVYYLTMQGQSTKAVTKWIYLK